MSRSSTPGFQFRRPNIPGVSSNAPSTTSGGGSGRPAAPTLGRTTITMEEWEAKAPLSEEEMRMVREVGDRLKEKPLPEKVSHPFITTNCGSSEINLKLDHLPALLLRKQYVD